MRQSEVFARPGAASLNTAGRTPRRQSPAGPDSAARPHSRLSEQLQARTQCQPDTSLGFLLRRSSAVPNPLRGHPPAVPLPHWCPLCLSHLRFGREGPGRGAEEGKCRFSGRHQPRGALSWDKRPAASSAGISPIPGKQVLWRPTQVPCLPLSPRHRVCPRCPRRVSLTEDFTPRSRRGKHRPHTHVSSMRVQLPLPLGL